MAANQPATAANETESYDAIVIGTGQGGKPLAGALAAAGRRTAVVERDAVGGSCVNYGCTPTKTMVASARVAWLARRAQDYGVETGRVSVDMKKVRERKRAIVESFRTGSEKRLERADELDLIRGEASFINSDMVQVQTDDGGTRRLAANEIIINTGLRAARPPIEGLDAVGALDNASIMELEEVPERLLVLGGGYIGLEFGQMFRRFGSEVAVIDRGEHLLSHEDPDIAEELAKILRDDGIEILHRTSGRRAARNDDGRLELTVAGPDGERTLCGSHLLVAVGRVPNSEALNLGAAGIDTDERGFIRVNERLETNVPGVYAIGDVKGGPAFTHVSYNDAMVLKANLLEGGRRTIGSRPLLYAVFTDPELGRVGLTEQEARGQGLRIRVAKMPMSHVARALEMGETRGVMKVVVDAESDQILGAAILGVHGGEVMTMLQITMAARLPYTALRDGMFAHPLFAESLNNLFASFEDA